MFFCFLIIENAIFVKKLNKIKKMVQKLFSIAYFPPIDYLIEMKNADFVFIESQENYQKQTYRNRTTILTGHGIYDLIIPIVRISEKRIKEIQIDNSMAWQKTHWKTIVSAYNNSPFFLYYRDFLETFFVRKYHFLFDFNFELLVMIRKLFDITNPVSLTEIYENKVKNVADFRDFFLPKNRIFRQKKVEYQQVFSDRFNFAKNIACIDYLFTNGTDF
jgi:hypothetical protein